MSRGPKPAWAGGNAGVSAARGAQNMPEWYTEESAADLEGGGSLREAQHAEMQRQRSAASASAKPTPKAPSGRVSRSGVEGGPAHGGRRERPPVEVICSKVN